jgi:RNA polymerase sigma-70 factor (ECF subfamily)
METLAFSLCLLGDFGVPLRHNDRQAQIALRRPADKGRTAAPTMESASLKMPSLQSDAELVAECVAGQDRAFHELTERYYRRVCAFLFKRVGQVDLVEDLAQETFLEAYRALKEGRPPEQFASWLFGIAANRCGKWFRRKKPSLFAAGDPPADLSTPFVSMQEELEEQEKRLARLEDALSQVSDETRTLLEMKHRHGKTCEQIGVELGQPVGTIKSTLSRTYKLLRSRLSRHEEATS